MSESMFEVDHKAGEMLTIKVRPPSLACFSPEAKEHIRASQKEFLLAIRSIIDAAIDMTSERAEKAEKKARKIVVE